MEHTNYSGKKKTIGKGVENMSGLESLYQSQGQETPIFGGNEEVITQSMAKKTIQNLKNRIKELEEQLEEATNTNTRLMKVKKSKEPCSDCGITDGLHTIECEKMQDNIKDL